MDKHVLTLCPIRTSDPAYPFVEGLLHSAFPECERRDDQQQRLNTDEHPQFRCLLIVSPDGPTGLLTYWDFGDFCYVEHFAIDEHLRCKRYGQEALRQFLSMAAKPVVLEVERPDTEIAARRIRFYERYGLNLWADHDYLQPPYRQGDQPVPMILMATPGLDPASDYQRVHDVIYSQVYGWGSL